MSWSYKLNELLKIAKVNMMFETVRNRSFCQAFVSMQGEGIDYLKIYIIDQLHPGSFL